MAQLIRKALIFVALLFLAVLCLAQNESRLQADLRREGNALKSCSQISKFADCGQTLVLGQPFHLAFGSLAPDNGMGFGLAFVEHKNFASEWRTNLSLDAVGTMNGSWRVGGYLKAYKLPAGNSYHVAPLFHLYSQSISLNRVDYFGLGPATTPLTHTTYGFSENITGADMAFPISISGKSPVIAILAELNGRFPSLRSGREKDSPSIETLFDETTAPGLTHQPGYFQPSEGVRLVPSLFGGRVSLNYLLQFQQFIAPGDSSYSFRRLNFDFNHTIPLSHLSKSIGKYYGSSATSTLPHNTPDYCGGAGREDQAMPCPQVSLTRKLDGSINLRAFISESFAGKNSQVPFYFMPTIGGSDLNGTPILPSYPDYRFRGSNLLLFQGTIEHSLGKLPIGALLSVDEAKIGLTRGDISIDHLRHSFSAGFTVHAGGLPVLSFVYAWGGGEGSHTTANVDSSLLGSASRPSLF
ncbi:MAG: hypothetical protein JST28_05110 [Acidobacteria bacterium]|nr:hypothetical protein [Acidobacteriota bacterium]